MLDLLAVLIISILITYVTIPPAIQSLTLKGISIPDRYKAGKPLIPTQGAIVVVFCAFLTIVISPIITRIINRFPGHYNVFDINQTDLAVLLVISLFAIYGIVDDLIDIGWWPKVLLPICFSFPLLVVLNPETISFPFFGNLLISDISFSFMEDFSIDGTDIFKILIIPFYVMVVANLVNMHSGFNGLQSGLSAILLATIIAKCIIDDKLQNLITPVSFFGSIIAFWFFNRYPARLFEGNIGSMVFGAIIGTTIIVNEYYLFGIFILTPHIIDFLLWFYERNIIKNQFTKFGELNSDGSIKAPTCMKMKFLFPFYFKLNEVQSVRYLYLTSFVFCASGLIIFP